MRRLPSALIASRMPLWVLPVVLLLQQLRSCLRSAGQADWIAAAESAEEEAVPAVKGVKTPVQRGIRILAPFTPISPIR